MLLPLRASLRRSRPPKARVCGSSRIARTCSRPYRLPKFRSGRLNAEKTARDRRGSSRLRHSSQFDRKPFSNSPSSGSRSARISGRLYPEYLLLLTTIFVHGVKIMEEQMKKR